MGTQTQVEVAGLLGLPIPALWSLSSNRSFPKPIGNDNAGNVVWNDSDVSVFLTLWTQTKRNGWKLPPQFLQSADFRLMAAAAPSAHYMHAPCCRQCPSLGQGKPAGGGQRALVSPS
jgi:hypothetical protein